MVKQVQFILASLLMLFTGSCFGHEIIQATSTFSYVNQNRPPDKQLLLNGRIWRNQFSKAVGDQFFLSNTFLRGSVIINGLRFNNLNIKYDIINDELLLSIESYPIIMMNKEMVDSFSLTFENRIYNMINAGTDTSAVLRGYVNVLYSGHSALYVKYTKQLHPLGVDGRYDLINQVHFVYLKKGNKIIPVTGKRKLLSLLEDKKREIRSFMKSNRIRIRWKDPDTFVPLLRYYDSLENNL
ncbi:MAG: hypothetical protein IQL11_10675 [Bacteroidales bacterium]|nr:hypothetical protein [Bacteroidales bacterium]